MPRTRLASPIAAGLILAAGAWSRAEAQDLSGYLAPRPAAAPMTPAAVELPPAGPEAKGPEASAGERPGRLGWLARWRRHRRLSKQHLQEAVLGFPEEFREPPLGHYVYAHGRIQVANGDAADMILRDFDFVPGTDRLNGRGQGRLARIAAQLPTNYFPLVVEQTPRTPGLDQQRRQAVLAALGRGSFPVPAERVVVGVSTSRGLTGMDAEMINQNMAIQTMTNGALGGVGGGAIGGTTGQGFGAQGPTQSNQPR